MEQAATRAPTYTLRRVASIVVALMSLLPMLLFAYTLYQLDVLKRPMAQFLLALALGISLIGYYIFWVMVSRMSEMVRAAADAPAPAAPSAETVESPPPAVAGFEIPGMGQVGEVHAFLSPIEQLGTVWRTEAEPHVGRRVLVSVMNSPEPIAGVLTQVTADGLLLDQDGRRVGITYRRISAIEAEREPTERAVAH
ncbi:MAG TPA: hypothetical protein VML54_06485 [Candidatus Limnocylindrales bacterium]|nr:hypothetical protein [Candidatus Limnocylindrales bacterium]